MRYLTCLALLFATAVLSSATDPDQLKDVNMVFVAPLEGQNSAVAQVLQAKIISSLTKVQGITVVENEDNRRRDSDVFRSIAIRNYRTRGRSGRGSPRPQRRRDCVVDQQHLK
jgi:hypothetical protein